MEDVYTLHVRESGGLFVESRPREESAYTVEIRSNGTGMFDGTPFAWSVHEDQMLWRFQNGAAVNPRTRFLIQTIS